MFSNTTLADIENEIRGEDDDIDENDIYKDPDFIRKISVSQTGIMMAKLSDETKVDDGIFVVYRNTTDNTETIQYSVWRYYKDLRTGWLREKHIFEFTTTSTINDMFLFDDYALFILDSEKVEATYFPNREDEWEVIEMDMISNDFERNN